MVTTVSSDLGIVPVGSHPQCEVSDGWRGVDRDDKKIDPLIVDVDDTDHAHVTAAEPVHGDLPAASQPDSASSAVPSDPAQRQSPDQDSLGSEFLDRLASSMAGSVDRGHHAPSRAPRAELLGLRLRRAEPSQVAKSCASTWSGLLV